MSFHKLSASQAAQTDGKPDEATKTAPVVGEPEAQSAKKQNEAAPAQRS